MGHFVLLAHVPCCYRMMPCFLKNLTTRAASTGVTVGGYDDENLQFELATMRWVKSTKGGLSPPKVRFSD